MLEKTGITVDIMAGYEEVLWGVGKLGKKNVL